MVYGIILAAGVGKRFKKKTIKPLFNINNQSLFLYALNTFLVSKQIDKVLLVINEKYQTHFKKCLSNVKYKNVMICSGDQNAR
jgi:2-C-methyl-D-erythritol 4-phosphate cytidylyltransferase